jgi:N-acylneuraminate cytidylyltransferase
VEVLALIPARGGSKGIARKNVREIGGKPLVAWSIEHALASALIGRTIVSTEDDEIADVARAYGAEVLDRPAELAADDSTDLDVFRHALGSLSELPEAVVHLRPTSPLRSPEVVDAAIRRLLDDPDADSLRSVSWPKQSPFKMWREAGSYLEPLLDDIPEAYNLPRQRLPEVWWQNGYVDVVRSRTVLEQSSMTGARILAFAIEGPVVELDYEASIAEAERLLRAVELAPAAPEHPS